MYRVADDGIMLLAQVIPSPARALVLSPIQFFFNSPKWNAAFETSFEKYFSIHRYTLSQLFCNSLHFLGKDSRWGLVGTDDIRDDDVIDFQIASYEISQHRPGLYACVCRASANEEIQHHAYDRQ